LEAVLLAAGNFSKIKFAPNEFVIAEINKPQKNYWRK